MRQMTPEPTVQSEVSQKEKDKYCILTRVWNLERWYWWAYLQGSNGDADIGNRLVNTAGEGEGGTHWAKSMDTYTWPYVK